MSDIVAGSAETSAEGEIVASDRLSHALRVILATNPELYIDVTGKPVVCLPLGGCTQDRTPHRLRGDRARATLFATVSRDAHFVPFQEEVNRILWILEDMAWKDIRMDVGYQSAVEQIDLIDALDILVNSVEGVVVYYGTCSGLRDRLNDVAIANGIDVRQEQWPKGASRLSQRIWELRHLLEAGGIQVERGRSNGPRWIKVSRLASSDGELARASVERREAKSAASQTLGSDDDSDGSVAALLRSIEAPSSEDSP